MKFDLHLHTTASDGTDRPADLCRMAAEQGFELIAITDHDTMMGVPEAQKAGRALNLRVIPGVEMSAGGDVEVHVLGYGIRDAAALERSLETMRALRHRRIRDMIARLSALGVDIAPESVGAGAEGGSVSRSHLARALVERGVVKTIKGAFDQYLSPGRPAYIPRQKQSVGDTVALIRSAGGAPVIAHPGQYALTWAQLERLLRGAMAAGLSGLEAYHPSHTARQCARFDQLARRLGLLVTGGSDYHGQIKPVMMGEGMRTWRTADEDIEAFLSHLSGGR